MRIASMTSSPAPSLRATSTPPSEAAAERELPCDAVAFSGIETAQDAVQLPVLDPAFQLGLAMGALSSAMGGAGGTVPKVAIDLVSQQGGQVVRAEYRMDLGNSETPLVGQGTIGDQPLQETARLDQGRLIWRGEIGTQSVQELTLEVDEETETVTMRGTMGAVEADLQLSPIEAGENPFAGLRTTGTLNGERYMVDTLIDMQENQAGRAESGLLRVRGHMNGSVIEKDYHVRVESNQNGFSLHADGGGVNAGTPQAVGINVRVLPPGAQFS